MGTTLSRCARARRGGAGPSRARAHPATTWPAPAQDPAFEHHPSSARRRARRPAAAMSRPDSAERHHHRHLAPGGLERGDRTGEAEGVHDVGRAPSPLGAGARSPPPRQRPARIPRSHAPRARASHVVAAGRGRARRRGRRGPARPASRRARSVRRTGPATAGRRSSRRPQTRRPAPGTTGCGKRDHVAVLPVLVLGLWSCPVHARRQECRPRPAEVHTQARRAW